MDCSHASSLYIKRFAVIDSTNAYARRNASGLWAAAGAARVVVVYADEQTAGRGQRGNVWQSAAGENLLATIMVRPASLPVVSQFALSQVIALAVREAVSKFGIEASLKWPNDIYVGNRKLAGILVELDYSGPFVEQAVIGVGLNVNQSAFAPMDKVPVSMKMLQGSTFDVENVLSALLETFAHYYSLLCSGEYDVLSAEYKKHLLGYDCVMRYRDAVSEFDAVIADVEGSGHLVLKRVSGTLSRYAFKEVELLL